MPRDTAFLDAMSHQGNDFQITNAFWAGLRDRMAVPEPIEHLRLQYLAGFALNRNEGDAMYQEMRSYQQPARGLPTITAFMPATA